MLSNVVFPMMMGKSLMQKEEAPLVLKGYIGDSVFSIEDITTTTSIEVEPVYKKDANGDEIPEAAAIYKKGNKIIVGSLVCNADYGDPLSGILGMAATDAPTFDLTIRGREEALEGTVPMTMSLKGVAITQSTHSTSSKSIGYSFCAVEVVPWHAEPDLY